jgi:hypothetical protein
MQGRNRTRWRERRDTIPARRRRRRRRRREIERSQEYQPLDVDPGSASRGVRSRLITAVGGLVVTMACLLTAWASAFSTFSATFALTIAASTFGASIALVMSARREEVVHQLANKLDRETGELESDAGEGLLPGGGGTDGAV